MAIEDRVIVNFQDDVKVAGRPPCGPGCPSLESRKRVPLSHLRNIHFQLALDLMVAFAAADRAAFLDDLAAPLH
jgi:hypothetical protein